MGLVEYKKIVVPVGDENGLLKWCIGHKLGDRYPSLESQRGNILVFDTEEDAQDFSDDEDNF